MKTVKKSGAPPPPFPWPALPAGPAASLSLPVAGHSLPAGCPLPSGWRQMSAAACSAPPSAGSTASLTAHSGPVHSRQTAHQL